MSVILKKDGIGGIGPAQKQGHHQEKQVQVPDQERLFLSAPLWVFSVSWFCLKVPRTRRSSGSSDQ
jgi:hypothetical protein